MSAKKIPIAPIFMDLPTVAQVVAMSTATIERLEREGQCRRCNSVLGLVNDDQAILGKLAKYLGKHGK